MGANTTFRISNVYLKIKKNKHFTKHFRFLTKKKPYCRLERTIYLTLHTYIYYTTYLRFNYYQVYCFILIKRMKKRNTSG